MSGLLRPKYRFLKKSFTNKILNVFGASVDLVSCESQELLTSMKSSLESSKIGPRLAVVPSGISDSFLEAALSAPRSAPEPSGHLKILLLGRINEPFKGLEIFLAALDHLQGAGVHFYMCGPSGPWSDSVIDNYFGNRPENRKMVTILPAASGVGEVVEIISSSNVLCLPSFDTTEAVESFGLVLVEAMACGVYFLASDSVPSARDLFGEGRFGEIFRSRDASDLANQIKKLIKNPGILARAKIEGPPLIAKKYTWDILAEQAIALCLESRAGKSLN
jgi:phosphatidylinositol alpha-mannosyltransferase